MANGKRIRLNRDLLLIGGPTTLVVIAAFAFTLVLMKPAPPHEISISTGTGDGSYHAYAVQYRDILARDGVTLRLAPSAGAVQNFRRLADPASDIDVAFVQGGIATGQAVDDLVSLGALYIEPVWVFHRGAHRATNLSALRGKMIAVGPEYSGTAALAMTMLHSNGLDTPPTTLMKIGGQAAANLLRSGGIDAMFLMADAGSPLVQELVRTPGIQLLSFERAEAYVRQHRFLMKLTLPQGVFDLERNIPDADITLLGTTANLMARKDLHPALTYLLLRAASEVHAKPTIFSDLRQFPAPTDSEVPLSPEAARYYKSGAPFLQRYLPYWAANLVDRLVLLLVPALAVLFPAMRVLPALYRWRVRSRIYRWYAKLKEIELELERRRSDAQLHDILRRLEAIDDAVNQLDTPLAYSDMLYSFREHIDLVRGRATDRLVKGANGMNAEASVAQPAGS